MEAVQAFLRDSINPTSPSVVRSPSSTEKSMKRPLVFHSSRTFFRNGAVGQAPLSVMHVAGRKINLKRRLSAGYPWNMRGTVLDQQQGHCRGECDDKPAPWAMKQTAGHFSDP